MQNVKVYLFLAPLLIAGFLAWRQLLRPGVRHWANYRMLALAILPGVGLFAPNIWVYYAVVLVCMIFVPRSRVEAIGLYILLALTLPFSNLWVTAGSTLLLPLNTISVMSLGLLASSRFKSDVEKRLRVWTGYDTAFALMMTLLFVVDMKSGDVKITNSIRFFFTELLFFVIPFWIISRGPITNIDPRRTLHYVGMAGFILSFEAVFEMLRHWSLYDAIDFNLGTSSTGLSKALLQRGGLLRAAGPYVESTGFGIILALCATIIFAQKSMFRSSLAHSIAMAVCCAGCFSALGRSGWLGFIVGLFVVSVFSGRIGALASFIFAGATVGVAAFLLIAESSLGGNLIGTTGHAASTIDYRDRLLEKGFEIFQNSPLLGSRSEYIIREYGGDLVSANLTVDFVNAYLYFGLYSGIIGLIIWMIYLFLPSFKLFRLRNAVLAHRYSGECATALFACSIVFATVMTVASFFERLPFMSMLFLAVARQLTIRLTFGYINKDLDALKSISFSKSRSRLMSEKSASVY